MFAIAMVVLGLAQAPEPASESVVVSPPPVAAPTPVVIARPAPPPVAPVDLPPPRYPDAPPKGTWLRVGGGLALGVGAVLGLGALVCYAATDGVGGSPGHRTAEQQSELDSLRGVALGLGIGALVHVAAGVPLVVVGHVRRGRYREWERRRPMTWSPRVQVGERWTLGLALRF